LGCEEDKYGLSFQGLNYKLLLPWKFPVYLFKFFIDYRIRKQNQSANNYMVAEIGINNYYRISPDGFKWPIELDGISKREIFYLQKASIDMIDKSEETIKRFCLVMEREYKESERHQFIRNFEIRYDLYLGCYDELNKIVGDIFIESRNDDGKDEKIKSLKDAIWNFKFDGTDELNIYTPIDEDNQRSRLKKFYHFTWEKVKKAVYYKTLSDSKPLKCCVCKSFAIGYLPSIDLIKPNDYDKIYDSYRIKFHKCDKDWTQYHFVAANNEIASFLYLLKDLLFQVEFTDSLDSIKSFKLKNIESNENIDGIKNFLQKILYEIKTVDGKTAIDLSRINHQNKFTGFIETVFGDLDKLKS
jgi:hypothetical protein